MTHYSEYHKRYYQRHKKKMKAAAKAWHHANPTKRRAHMRKYTYGLTEDIFQQMWTHQDGKCAICQCVLRHDGSTHIDHDHETDKIRGLLCYICNRGLGHFKDRPELFRRAANYLESSCD